MSMFFWQWLSKNLFPISLSFSFPHILASIPKHCWVMQPFLLEPFEVIVVFLCAGLRAFVLALLKNKCGCESIHAFPGPWTWQAAPAPLHHGAMFMRPSKLSGHDIHAQLKDNLIACALGWHYRPGNLISSGAYSTIAALRKSNCGVWKSFIGMVGLELFLWLVVSTWGCAGCRQAGGWHRHLKLGGSLDFSLICRATGRVCLWAIIQHLHSNTEFCCR